MTMNDEEVLILIAERNKNYFTLRLCAFASLR